MTSVTLKSRPFGFALSKIQLLAQRTREKWGTLLIRAERKYGSR
jgi:hypothetical protein